MKRICYLLLLFAFGMSGIAVGQTNPTAQALPYTQDFSSLAHSSTTLPAGWAIWTVFASAELNTFRTNAPSLDRSLLASSTSATTTGGFHNYNGKIGFLNNASLDLSMALSVNTTGSSNIVVVYDLMTIRNPHDASSNTRINGVELQYRIGTEGAFTSVRGAVYFNNATTQTTAVTTPQKLVNYVVTLPSACDNQSVVQIRWISRALSGAGSRPSFAIDNIDIRQNGNQTQYYSKSTGNLEELTSWGTNTDGSGSNPASFTAGNQIFNIRNNSTPTIGATWTVAGTGSKIVVGDGINPCTFTIPSSFALDGLIDVNSNAVLRIQNTTIPNIGSLASTSTVEYAQTSATSALSNPNYGELRIIGNSIKSFAGNTTITGNLAVSSSGTLSVSGAVVLTIGGNLEVEDGSILNPGSSGSRFVCNGSNKTFTLNGVARVTSNQSQTGAAANSPFSYQYNGFTTYTFGSSSWVSFRCPSLTALIQGIDGISGSPFANVEIGGVSSLITSAHTASHPFKTNVEITGNLAFPRTNANTQLSIDFSTFTVKVGGKILLDGVTLSTIPGGRTYTTTSSTIELNGSSAQTTLGGTDLPSSFNNLTINNSNGVTLENDITVNGTLSLQNGVFNRNGKTLTLSGTVTGSGLSGISQTTELNAPASANVGNLGFLISSSANLGNTTVTRGYSSLTGNSNSSILRWYRIVPTTNTGLNATIVFPYSEGSELNGIAESKLRLFRSTDNGSTWTLEGGTVDEGANTVTLSGVDQFSLWTLGDVDNPLPVELTSFTASSVNGTVNLNWATATEVSNYGFDVERSADKSVWNKIGFVPGNGNSNSVKSYSYSDNTASAGTVYYRLKQLDTDGKYEYSKVVSVNNTTPDAFTVDQNFPNPFNPSTTIRFSLANSSNVKVDVYASNGELVHTLANKTFEAGNHAINFDASQLSAGIYLYRITAIDAAGKSFSAVKKMQLIK